MEMMNGGSSGIVLLVAVLLYAMTKALRLLRRRKSTKNAQSVRTAMIADLPWLLATMAYVVLTVEAQASVSVIGLMLLAVAILTIAGDIMILLAFRGG